MRNLKMEEPDKAKERKDSSGGGEDGRVNHKENSDQKLKLDSASLINKANIDQGKFKEKAIRIKSQATEKSPSILKLLRDAYDCVASDNPHDNVTEDAKLAFVSSFFAVKNVKLEKPDDTRKMHSSLPSLYYFKEQVKEPTDIITSDKHLDELYGSDMGEPLIDKLQDNSKTFEYYEFEYGTGFLVVYDPGKESNGKTIAMPDKWDQFGYTSSFNVSELDVPFKLLDFPSAAMFKEAIGNYYASEHLVTHSIEGTFTTEAKEFDPGKDIVGTVVAVLGKLLELMHASVHITLPVGSTTKLKQLYEDSFATCTVMHQFQYTKAHDLQFIARSEYVIQKFKEGSSWVYLTQFSLCLSSNCSHLYFNIVSLGPPKSDPKKLDPAVIVYNDKEVLGSPPGVYALK